MIEITVHKISGICPVPNEIILEYEWCPLGLGLNKEDDRDNAYFQCLDPGEPYKKGGTVIFGPNKPEQ